METLYLFILSIVIILGSAGYGMLIHTKSRRTTKDIGLWIGYKNGNVYNSYSGDFRGAGNSEDRPGGVGFEYRTFGERVTSFFKNLFP